MSDQSIKTVSLPVTGMTCAACASTVEKTLGTQPGVTSAEVNLAGNTVQLKLNEVADIKQLSEALSDVGYGLISAETEEATEQLAAEATEDRYKKTKNNLLGSALFTLPVFVMSILMEQQYSSFLLLKVFHLT